MIKSEPLVIARTALPPCAPIPGVTIRHSLPIDFFTSQIILVVLDETMTPSTFHFLALSANIVYRCLPFENLMNNFHLFPYGSCRQVAKAPAFPHERVLLVLEDRQ